MIRNFIAIISYTIFWWLTIYAGSFSANFIRTDNIFFISLFLIFLPFFVSPFVPMRIAKNRPILIAFLGTLFHHFLLFAFAPLAMRMLIPSSTPDLGINNLIPDPSSPKVIQSLRVASIVFLPFTSIISISLGFVYTKLRKK